MVGTDRSDGDVCLYVLEMEPGRDPNAMWYVGITTHPEQRYGEHCNGSGAEWTAYNTCVNMHVLLWGKRRFMRSLEDQLTLALWEEYGPWTTRGGTYTGRRFSSGEVPEEDVAIEPPLAEALEATGDERLAKLSERSRVYVEIEEIPFQSVDEVEEWADHALPEGTELRLSTPGYDLGTFYAEDPEKAVEEQSD